MDEDSGDVLKNGVRVETLSSWHEFHKEILNLRSKRGYVWRGQRQDWGLRSKFDREVRFKDQKDRKQKLLHHLGNFKNEMRKSFQNVLPPEDIDIWALGQHYGLWTPLLDWTLSPYIAAYFAFIEGGEPNNHDDNYRYVYALNRSLEQLLLKRKKEDVVISSDRPVPFIDKLSYPNPRFLAQKGIFTRAFQGDDIRDYARNFSKKRPNELLIVKFRIPTRDREECLVQLHLMNIDHASLLLDFHDVVNNCNSKLS